LAFWSGVLAAPPVQAQEWKELKGEHFIIYSTEGDGFPAEVLKQAEQYYKTIADELGYQRYSNFWTWDNRVRIYIFPDKKTFLQATGQPSWSEGMADYHHKSIVSYAWNEGFLEDLLPHEIAHLIFRDYVGFKGEVPLWLDEGVAQWMEFKKREAVKHAIKDLVRRDKIISLPQLLEMDVRRVVNSEMVRIYYIESVSLVSFLITQYGSNNFTIFCRQLRDGKSLNRALSFAYPTSIRDVHALDERWQKYIREGR
jgi:hypothetical protein